MGLDRPSACLLTAADSLLSLFPILTPSVLPLCDHFTSLTNMKYVGTCSAKAFRRVDAGMEEGSMGGDVD